MKQLDLIPLAMVTPSLTGVYAPSRIREPMTVSYAEFLARYADHPRPILVSLAPDGKSDPQAVTAYGVKMDAWWIVSEAAE